MSPCYWSSDLCSSDLNVIGRLSYGLPAAGQANPYESLPITFAQVLISGVGTIVAGAIFYPFSAAVSRSEERRVGKAWRSRPLQHPNNIQSHWFIGTIR